MATFIYYSPTIWETGILPNDVLDMLHETDCSPDNPVVSDVSDIYGRLHEISDIKGGYAIFEDIERFPETGEIRIENRILKTSHKICKLMEGAERMVVFICTAGQGFTEDARRYNKEGDYLKGYIVDTLGSALVEKSMDFIQAALEKQMQKDGMNITNRYSPGYCNWPIDDQKQLFSLLPFNQCDIMLSESCLMIPIKSVSGIIGIGKKVKKSSYSCAICNNLTCIYRKVKNKNNQY